MLTVTRFNAGEGSAAERALYSHCASCTLCSLVLLRPSRQCVEGLRLEREAEGGPGGRRRDRVERAEWRGARGRA
jgi:hypothetical protein